MRRSKRLSTEHLCANIMKNSQLENNYFAKCELVPRRARIQGSWTLWLESNKEEEEREHVCAYILETYRRLSTKCVCAYRGTSLIRKRLTLGPYSRTMPRTLP